MTLIRETLKLTVPAATFGTKLVSSLIDLSLVGSSLHYRCGCICSAKTGRMSSPGRPPGLNPAVLYVCITPPSSANRGLDVSAKRVAYFLPSSLLGWWMVGDWLLHLEALLRCNEGMRPLSRLRGPPAPSQVQALMLNSLV